MSWGFSLVAVNAEVAKKRIADFKEPTLEQNYGIPAAAKALVLAAIDASGFGPEYAVKVEASGHSPNGSTRVLVEPVVIYKE